MFTFTIQEYKMREQEQIRKAQHQRLLRTIARPAARPARNRSVLTWIVQLLIS